MFVYFAHLLVYCYSVQNKVNISAEGNLKKKKQNVLHIRIITQQKNYPQGNA